VELARRLPTPLGLFAFAYVTLHFLTGSANHFSHPVPQESLPAATTGFAASSEIRCHHGAQAMGAGSASLATGKPGLLPRSGDRHSLVGKADLSRRPVPSFWLLLLSFRRAAAAAANRGPRLRPVPERRSGRDDAQKHMHMRFRFAGAERDSRRC